MNSEHSERSLYIEKMIEHLFIGELLKVSWVLWLKGRSSLLEVAKPEVDDSGYDVILEANEFVRHVQLKSSILGGKTSQQTVHKRLAEKPSGCVVWVRFDEETLELKEFLFYGSKPGRRLSLHNLPPVAKRPNTHRIRKGLFDSYESAEEIYQVLFGENSITSA